MRARRTLLGITLVAALVAQAGHAAEAAGPAAASGRRGVVVLYKPEAAGVIHSGTVTAAVEAVLNHLGLVVWYHDVTRGAPPADLGADARGVIATVPSGVVPDPVALAGWLRRRQADGTPVLLLDGHGFLAEAADGTAIDDEVWKPVLTDVGVAPGGPTAEGPGDLAWLPSTWPAFEAGPPPLRGALASVRRLDAEAEAPSRVRDARAASKEALTLPSPGGRGGAEGGSAPMEGDTVVVGPRGAYAAAQDQLFETNPFTNRLRWRLDPFRLFGMALRTRGLPAPDPTTVNGRRAFYAHIDGDGFANKAIEPRERLSAEVVRDEVLAGTWLPTTVSLITREIKGKKDREDLARSLFRLPHVDAGIHTWTHPHDWEKGFASPQDTVGDAAVVQGRHHVVFKPKLEIDDAVRYTQSLLPPGKQVALVQWSGMCNPTEPFFARASALGIANLNGGDAIIQPDTPSVAGLAPFGRRVGPYLQIYTSAANENIYTNLWTGPFDGQRRALDFFTFTGAPRRLAAVNIYYHYYAAERIAGLKALRLLYAWAERQPLAHLTASGYARMVEGFAAARLQADGPGAWTVQGAGRCRTLRLDGEARRPDLDASTGVAGWLAEGDRLYVHLAAGDARLVLADAPPARPRLESASAPLAGWVPGPTSLRAAFDAAAPARVTFAGLPPGAPLRYKGDFKGPARAGADGRVTLTAARGRRWVEVAW